MMRRSSLGAAVGSACLAILLPGCHRSPATSTDPASAASTFALPSAIIASAAPDPRDIETPPAASSGASANESPEPSATAPSKHPSAAPSQPTGASAKPTATKPEPEEPKASASAAPSAPPPPKQHTVRGTSVGAEHFSVSIQAPSPVMVGKSATATIVLVAKSPFHCNDKYPYKFKLDAPGPGVSYPSSLARGMSVRGAHGSMGVPFTGRQPGRATVSGTLYMSVCSADQCMMDRRRLAVSVQIQ